MATCRLFVPLRRDVGFSAWTVVLDFVSPLNLGLKGVVADNHQIN
jgi:hypothetical protein